MLREKGSNPSGFDIVLTLKKAGATAIAAGTLGGLMVGCGDKGGFQYSDTHTPSADTPSAPSVETPSTNQEESTTTASDSITPTSEYTTSAEQLNTISFEQAEQNFYNLTEDEILRLQQEGDLTAIAQHLALINENIIFKDMYAGYYVDYSWPNSNANRGSSKMATAKELFLMTDAYEPAAQARPATRGQDDSAGKPLDKDWAKRALLLGGMTAVNLPESNNEIINKNNSRSFRRQEVGQKIYQALECPPDVCTTPGGYVEAVDNREQAAAAKIVGEIDLSIGGGTYTATILELPTVVNLSGVKYDIIAHVPLEQAIAPPAGTRKDDARGSIKTNQEGVPVYANGEPVTVPIVVATLNSIDGLS